MDDDGRSDDVSSVWSPETSQPEYASLSAAVFTTASSTSSTYSTLSNVHSFTPSQFPSSYFHMVPAPSDLYPSQSSYERISPVDDYRDVTSGSDQISSFSNLSADNTHLMSHHVDSSTMQPGYQLHHMVLDGHHRVVAVQRVVPQEECSSSQSNPMGYQREQMNTPSNSSMMPSTSSYSNMQVSSMPNFHVNNVTNEVSTSDNIMMPDDRRQPIGDRDGDHTVSSALQGNIMSSASAKVNTRHLDNDMDSLSNEPDTTQGISHDYGHSSTDHSFINGHSSIDDPNIDSTRLHSSMNHDVATLHSSVSNAAARLHSSINHNSATLHSSVSNTTARIHSSMTNGPLPSGSDAVDLSVENDQLTSSHEARPVVPQSLSASSMDANMDQTVDSSGVSVDIGERCGYSGEAPSMEEMMAVEGSSTNSCLPMMSYRIEANKENIPQSSNSNSVCQLRKSNRIATMEEEENTPFRPPEYVSKEYNPQELWCEECMTTYSGECPQHKLLIVPDKVVLSRAWSSLPPMLQIFRLSNTGSIELGVFAKRTLTKNTQFGPFISELVPNQELVTNKKFLLLVERPPNEILYYETSDENKCNWMMFIRPAENYAEQNMVAYQHNQDIYFTVIKNIEAKQELRVWYAAHYAERIGARVHELTDQDIEALDEQGNRYSCYDCNKGFKTGIALQKHMITHEETSNHGDDDDYQSKDEAKKTGRKPGEVSSGIFRKRGRQPKPFKDYGDGGYQWKKKSTSIYLNKTLKKYQKRTPQAIRRSIQSLYRKKERDQGINEWVCTHCDLTFDNSNLLNLHTLTHAAEDVGLDELKKFTFDFNAGVIESSPQDISQQIEGMIALEPSSLACPVCHQQFAGKGDLIQHVAEHGKTKRPEEPEVKPYKCDKCWKAFAQKDRLQKHLLCHGSEDTKPLQCKICFKRLMNNSALSCHMKTHSNKKYYECPICRMDFNQISILKEHVLVHKSGNVYPCMECGKQFEDFLQIKKHMKTFHSPKKYPCTECDKVFPRPDKLKLHMLRHSSIREFMCENCGRQFKRKDKLKEHIRRMHSAEREAKNALKAKCGGNIKKFIPKVSPSDYHRFIYKCHQCLLGFKRRGMLVNHLAKRHPEVKPDTVPELNLPILKTQRDYYCQYCDKVYKSSSKRKAHIVKNHPGAELPMSSRNKTLIPEIPGLPNPTYSQTVGSITTMPHGCTYCHKQYASKAKLLQHQRKKHSNQVPQALDRRRRETREIIRVLKAEAEQAAEVQAAEIAPVERYEPEPVQNTQVQGQAEVLPAADLLTQAMSELTQTLEYRGTEFHIPARLAQAAAPTMLQVQAQPTNLQHSTIELSHLGQTLAHTQFAIQQPQQPPPPQQQQQHPQPQHLSPPQPVTLAAVAVATSTPPQQAVSPQTVSILTSQGQTVQAQTVPVTLAQNYIPRSWTLTYANYR